MYKRVVNYWKDKFLNSDYDVEFKDFSDEDFVALWCYHKSNKELFIDLDFNLDGTVNSVIVEFGIGNNYDTLFSKFADTEKITRSDIIFAMNNFKEYRHGQI